MSSQQISGTKLKFEGGRGELIIETNVFVIFRNDVDNFHALRSLWHKFVLITASD